MNAQKETASFWDSPWGIPVILGFLLGVVSYGIAATSLSSMQAWIVAGVVFVFTTVAVAKS